MAVLYASASSSRWSHGAVAVGRSARPSQGPADQDGVEHGLGELAGEGVLLAHVVAAEDRAAVGQRPPRRRGRTAGGAARRGCRPAPGSRSRRATTNTRASQQRQLPVEERAAGVALVGGGLVGRRRAPDRRGDPGAREREPVVDATRSSAGWRSPARCRAAYRKSPERSPVNIRPVRLAPWAAGARPDDQQRGPSGRRSRAPAGPSSPRRGRRPASRWPPAPATPPGGGRPEQPTTSASTVVERQSHGAGSHRRQR